MKTLSSYLNYLILLVAAIYGAVYFLDFKPTPATKLESKAKVDIDQVVNKFLKQTSEQTIKDQMAFKSALQKQLDKPIEPKRPKLNAKPEDIPANQQIWKADSLTPAEIIQAESQRKEQLELQVELDKQEYARQFVENARKSGYHVVLSSDYKVLSVTPIRKPSQFDQAPELFPTD